jgi:hypothetical protein
MIPTPFDIKYMPNGAGWLAPMLAGSGAGPDVSLVFASVLSHRSAVGLAAGAGGCSYCDSC